MPANARLLTAAMKSEIKRRAQEGKTYIEIAEALGPPADLGTVKAYCESAEIWTFKQAKRFITSRLNRMRTAGRREERDRLANEIQPRVDYLAARLKQMRTTLNDLRRVVRKAEEATGEE